MQKTALTASFVLALFTAQAPASSDEDPSRFDLGLRAGTTMADGEPANDIPGLGLYAHYRWHEHWTLGFGLDRTEFDYEQPARILGITQPSSIEAIDAVAEATIASAWLERTFAAPQARTVWFLGSGLAFASLDVPAATGPREDGGSFDIRTEADDEIIVSLLAGVRRRAGENWFVEFTLRADRHFANWESIDQVSGATGSVDDYFAYGGYLGLGWRF